MTDKGKVITWRETPYGVLVFADERHVFTCDSVDAAVVEIVAFRGPKDAISPENRLREGVLIAEGKILLPNDLKKN
jgi:hypothetical protein